MKRNGMKKKTVLRTEQYIPIRGRGGCNGVMYLVKGKRWGISRKTTCILLRFPRGHVHRHGKIFAPYLTYGKTIVRCGKPILTVVEEKIKRRAMVYIAENFTSDISREGLPLAQHAS